MLSRSFGENSIQQILNYGVIESHLAFAGLLVSAFFSLFFRAFQLLSWICNLIFVYQILSSYLCLSLSNILFWPFEWNAINLIIKKPAPLSVILSLLVFSGVELRGSVTLRRPALCGVKLSTIYRLQKRRTEAKQQSENKQANKRQQQHSKSIFVCKTAWSSLKDIKHWTSIESILCEICSSFDTINVSWVFQHRGAWKLFTIYWQ